MAETGNSIHIDKWLKLKGADGVGSITFLKILNHFGTIEKALGASVKELSLIEGIGFKTAEQIASTRNKFDAISELELAEKLGVTLISYADQRYPVLLKRIYDPPPVLYIKGTIEKMDNLSIAIVGSRRCSTYGQEQASRFSHLLATAGFTICSGMARGIDTAAHQGALSANGRTIAVQGCGLANIFPPENKKLFEMISQNGAVVSELPLRYEPLAENFPPRNRIIAGLSLGVIVIEAGLRSGSLITAKSAIENNREVMAIPGKIDSPLNGGTHQLIKDGARLIDCVEDVVEALGHIGKELKDHVEVTTAQAQAKIDMPLFDAEHLKLSESERIVYDCLGKEPLHIERLIGEVDLDAGSVSGALVALRLKGLIKQVEGNFFMRK
jgi:DNA processing protein